MLNFFSFKELECSKVNEVVCKNEGYKRDHAPAEAAAQGVVKPDVM